MKKITKNYHGRLGLIVIGSLASLMVAFTLTPAFAGIVASIQNTTNTAATGTLTMKESSGAATCNSFDGQTNNTATCSTINKYGGTSTPLLPGGAAKVTDVTIQNTGNIAATSFTLTPGGCTSSNVSGASFSGGGDLCTKVKVVITSGTTTLFNGTAAALNTGGAIDILNKLGKTSVTANESIPIKFSVSLDPSADATFQGKQISQPLTWQFGA
ncbi:MAG: hypothetical protein Q3996_00210 [Candidatus Saccharibacteria bacterium]|nr:hypothetical protein [Candidatus Saccharibacteria bacterium]